jgi:hypothetical protein
MRARAGTGALLAAVLAGCGGGSSSPNAPVVSGAFTMTVAPNPIVAADCDPAVCGSAGVLLAVGNVTITESAGTGGFVNLIGISLRNAATNAEVGVLEYTASDIAAITGTNRVNRNGTLTIPNLGAAYRLPGGARAATMAFAAAITDDNGNQRSFLVTVPVI